MGREADILTAIDDMGGFDFQRLVCRLLQRERFPSLNPLPDQQDLGVDAEIDEISVLKLPNIDADHTKIAISKTDKLQKVRSDCSRCQEEELDVRKIIFVTSGDVTKQRRINWGSEISDQFGWDLTVIDRTWIRDIIIKPAHEKLVEETFGIPPLGGDYYDDIIELFEEETEQNRSSIAATLPHTDEQISRKEVDEVISNLREDNSVIVTGSAGTGKSGILDIVADEFQNLHVFFLDARQISEVANESQFRDEFGTKGSLANCVGRAGLHHGCLLIVDQIDNIGATPAAEILVDFVDEVSDKAGVRTVVGCRDWELDNRREFEHFKNEDYHHVTVSSLEESQVQDILDGFEIKAYSSELLELGRNLLNLSLIAELVDSDEQVDYTEIKNQTGLWKLYVESLESRERRGSNWDQESGAEVLAKAIDISEKGLKKNSRLIPIDRLRFERETDRLISRTVIIPKRNKYKFRHEELQDYLYAWNGIYNRGWSKPNHVLNELDELAAAGVFRWMIRTLADEDPVTLTEFVDEALSGDTLGLYAASSILDEAAHWNPEAHDEAVIEVFLKRALSDESYEKYFLTNIPDSEWVEQLHDHGWFDNPSGSLLSYLDRVACDIPEQVVTIISDTEATHEVTRARFVKIAASLPGSHAKTCVDTFVEWLPDAEPEMGSYAVHYNEFIESLLQKGKVSSAMQLLSALLDPQPPNPTVEEIELSDGSVYNRVKNNEPTALGRIHTLENGISTARDELDSIDYEYLITILEDRLRLAIVLELDVRDENPSEYTWPNYIGESTLTNTKLKEVLIDECRDTIDSWIGGTSGDKQEEFLHRYLDDWLVFRRLALYLLAGNPENYKSIIRAELLSPDNYNNPDIENEFYYLLHEVFSDFPNIQSEILTLIGDIERQELIELAEDQQERYGDKDIDEVVDEEIGRRKIRRYRVIENDLPEGYSTELQQLTEQIGDPLPFEFERDSRGRISGFTVQGPIESDEFADFPPSQQLELCLTWDPENEEDEVLSSRQTAGGLAVQIEEQIGSNPQGYEDSLEILREADTIYISHAFKGFREALENDLEFSWGSIISLSQEAVTREDNEGVDCRLQLCRLFRSAFVNEITAILKYDDNIRDLLVGLVNDPHPDVDEEYDEFDEKEEPAVTSLNSVRPRAVEAVILYSLASAKNNDFEGFDGEGSSGFDPEIRACLEEKLDDPNPAVHSIFGKRLRNLYWLDRPFVDDNLDKIFPTSDEPDSIERFCAAWSAYITRTPWVKSIYSEIKPRYMFALELHQRANRFSGNSDQRGLVIHGIRSYIHGGESLDEPNSFLPTLYEKTSPDWGRSVSWQLWKWADENPEFVDYWDEVRTLWEWRVDRINNLEDHASEFEWFVNWVEIMPEEFNPSEEIELLVKTAPFLCHTRRGWETVENYLSYWINREPLACIRIYHELVDQPDHPPHYRFDGKPLDIVETALQAGGESKEIGLKVAENLGEYNLNILDFIEKYGFDR